MGRGEPFTLGIRLAAVLVLLSLLFAGVVYLTHLDAGALEARVHENIEQQVAEQQRVIEQWYEKVAQEHARQIAAPFLWDVDSLEGLDEGDPNFERLQTRMRQFVYGRDREPALALKPVGPLESVVVIDPSHRIVAASDSLTVDQRFTDPHEIRMLEKALHEPQVMPRGEPRDDGQQVVEVSVGVPNARGKPIGVVRLRYVGGTISKLPDTPTLEVTAQPRLWGPILAGLVAVLGVGFGAVATFQVIALTRRIQAMAQGMRLPPPTRGPGREALSLIEARLESLSDAVRRDDILVTSLTEALREGVILFDPEARPVIANRQAVVMLGGSRWLAEEREQAWRSWLATNPPLLTVVKQAIEERRAVRERPLELHTADGKLTSVQATSYVLQDRERVAGVLVLLKDRASIEALDRNLREASKLQAIVRLTGSVAHEVKNPLGAIRVHLEQLRRKVAKLEQADPAAGERIEVLNEEIGRLEQILNEWLSFTSPEERAPAFAAVSEVLHSVARLLRVEARHQKVDLIVEQRGELGEVALSTARLRQVLLNLALNSLQAMPHGGQLTFSARQHDETIDITIEDTGIGIPERLKERVFDFHFTTRTGGSGLGLPICQRLVEAAGGTIEFHSIEGSGTTFVLKLPMRGVRREEVPLSASREGASPN
ncbi:MAG: hypothetical protein JSV80_02805 [Acidobacteriota bacterium]|nr:MAG: hypothetical protein JSV80_02805 [Acidobacteriota bacterium]